MGDCPCNAEEIMATAKTKKASGGDVLAKLDDALIQMSQEAETPSADVTHDAVRRQCIQQLDAVIKFIKARW